jgi:hypothetical protein
VVWNCNLLIKLPVLLPVFDTFMFSKLTLYSIVM